MLAPISQGSQFRGVCPETATTAPPPCTTVGSRGVRTRSSGPSSALWRRKSSSPPG
ncbi:hypothetical protein DUI70_3240 [Streptomyces albus]|nr:hypothetical protein DUI70_3240 [Streptomyces albus]